MKKILYLFPRSFSLIERQIPGRVYYLVDGNTGEVLLYLVEKKDLIEDLKKSIKQKNRINWIFNSKDVEIKLIKSNIIEWKEVKEKIHLWHERKKNDPELLVIVEREPIILNSGEKRFLFYLILFRTGERLATRMCSEKSYALNDLKSDLMDIRNDKWNVLGNRCEIKHLSETNISKSEIDRRYTNWGNNQIKVRSLKNLNLNDR